MGLALLMHMIPEEMAYGRDHETDGKFHPQKTDHVPSI
jgi:hypothetical protein